MPQLSDYERQVVDRAVEREGGWVLTDHAGDRGGLTAAGVTLKTYNAWRVKRGLGPLPADEFKADAEAGYPHFQDAIRTLYCDEFLAPLSWVPNAALRELVFDAAVTSGVKAAVKMLQRAAGSAPDGVAGPNTQAALRAAMMKSPTRLMASFTENRCVYFARIVQRDETQARWLAGWTRRAFHMLTGAL